MRDDDALLTELARLSREEAAGDQARLDERWDRLSAGELGPAEEAELRALAAGSDAAGQAYEAFRPLGPGFEARLVQELERLDQPAGESPAGKPPGSETAGRLLPFRRPAAWLAAAAAFAAMLVVFFRPVPLPMYQLAIQGGSRESRELVAAPLFTPGDNLLVNLHPLTAVHGAFDARAFLIRGAEVHPWKPHQDVSTDGALQLEGTLPLELTPGVWTLWVVVGRSGKLPDDETLREIMAAPSPRLARSRDWIVLRETLQVRCGPSSQSC